MVDGISEPLAKLHGHATDLKYDELKTFRERLLFAFHKGSRGALATMLAQK